VDSPPDPIDERPDGGMPMEHAEKDAGIRRIAGQEGVEGSDATVCAPRGVCVGIFQRPDIVSGILSTTRTDTRLAFSLSFMNSAPLLLTVARFLPGSATCDLCARGRERASARSAVTVHSAAVYSTLCGNTTQFRRAFRHSYEAYLSAYL